MASSDSGEDFESADEGFDVEETVSNKKIISKISESCGTLSGNDQEEPQEKIIENIQQSINIVKLENLPQQEPKSKSIDTCSPSVDNSDKTKAKPPKKLGTKLSSSNNVKSSILSVKDRVVSDEKKDGHSNVNTIHKVTKDLSDIHESITSRPIDNLQESRSSVEQSAPNKSPSNDGWDFEEEDGFSIPSALLKINPTSGTQLKQEQDQSWGSWGVPWGVSSLLTTATDSVTTFSSQVTAGLSTVLETTVGAPDPESLAASTRTEQDAALESKRTDDNLKDEEEKATVGYGGFGSLVSGVSMLGTTVISRGLDTLESLGKKTMEVLQEGDPGLKKKRAILFADQDKPVLSQILREAKEKAEHSDKEREEKETARKAHFESLFDDFQGMVHLEALEMLSTQCQLKLQSLLLGETGTALDDLHETMSQIQDLCELPDDDDEFEELTCEQFNEQITKSVDGLRIKYSAEKITQVNEGVIARIDKLGAGSEMATVVHQTAISSLAEFTAAAMECFHKSAELLMAKSYHNTADEAENYVQLTGLLCARVSAMANEFTQLLTKNHPIANSSLITNIFLEASNSCSYTRNACQLLVPILQVGALSS